VVSADLAAFLLAQLAEDEAEARDCREGPDCDPETGCPAHPGLGYVYQDCDSKRRIIAHVEGFAASQGVEVEFTSGWMVLRLLALPYSDAPGYRREWRP
jgi:Family of unknown function (DUF6221)